ncbi:MAG: hypothetical protein FJ115_03115 [Deltaproteobacteria bacterium]|nr:hypothetical protein [Deltaproteobacteria bacterium]MBM4322526.1 hypothetical protein [Deltaproteobacteria bacterium]
METMDNNRHIKVALVCTAGGHFEQMTNLSDFYNLYQHFWITNRNRQTESHLKQERVYYINSAHFKKPWAYFRQIFPVLKAFAKEKPTHILSTGSGRTTLIPFLLSRFFKASFIHIDTFSRVYGYSKFGTFMLKTHNKIYTQWEDPTNRNATYIGPIFKQQGNRNQSNGSRHIFVTVGTRSEPFTRLLKSVETLVTNGTIKEKVIVQAGHTNFKTSCAEVFDFCGSEEIDRLIANASYVITQESAGVGTQCLRHGTRFIVMPRDYRYGELNTKSDMNEDLHYKLQELGYTKVVKDTTDLEKAILDIKSLKTGFHFDNTLAIQTLKQIIEGNRIQ